MARIRELCLEFNTRLDEIGQAVFSSRSEFSAQNDPREHAVRWVALRHRAEVMAPAAIYDAAEAVSAILTRVDVLVVIAPPRNVSKEEYQRLSQEATWKYDKERALGLAYTYETAGENLRRTCRTEQGEEPLPTPSRR
jgi:hypothetical protein